jgi:hypothetical protein
MLSVAQVAVYTTHKYSVGRTYHCLMLNLLVHRVTRRLKKYSKISPYTDLERPWGFQEVEAPRFQANRHIPSW